MSAVLSVAAYAGQLLSRKAMGDDNRSYVELFDDACAYATEHFGLEEIHASIFTEGMKGPNPPSPITNSDAHLNLIMLAYRPA